MMMTMTVPAPCIVKNVVPNPHCRDYHVNTRISTDYIECFLFPLRESSEKYLKQVGEVGANLIRKLSDTPGVTEASLSQYSVQILNGEAFDWEDMEEDILLALKECFGNREDEVEVIDRDTRHLYCDGPRDIFDDEPPLPRNTMSMSDFGGSEDSLDEHETDSGPEGDEDEAEHKTNE